MVGRFAERASGQGLTHGRRRERAPEVVLPNPKGNFAHTCSYVLGDFTATRQGLRFVADATITNTVNIGIIAKATAKWKQAGGPPVSLPPTRCA